MVGMQEVLYVAVEAEEEPVVEVVEKWVGNEKYLDFH
jgi:hypothetical protein